MQARITVREARATISTILASSRTVAIGQQYQPVRGFIVSVPNHSTWNKDEKKKALAAARKEFDAAIRAESK